MAVGRHVSLVTDAAVDRPRWSPKIPGKPIAAPTRRGDPEGVEAKRRSGRLACRRSLRDRLDLRASRRRPLGACLLSVVPALHRDPRQGCEGQNAPRAGGPGDRAGAVRGPLHPIDDPRQPRSGCAPVSSFGLIGRIIGKMISCRLNSGINPNAAGHAAVAPSSRFATATLRFARFAVTARRRRGLSPP